MSDEWDETGDTLLVDRPVAAPRVITAPGLGRAWRALVQAVGELLDGRERIWALEAGAGSRTLFELPEDAFVVGVGPDARALEANARLDQRVAVTLADYRPPAADFDLISCWYALDDLADPGPVLDRFADWAADGAVIVLASENLLSPRGLVRRLRRRLRLRRSLTPRGLARRFAEQGFTPVLQVFFEDAEQAARRRRLHLVGGWWSAAQAAVRLLSLGRLDAARTDHILVLRRDG